MASPPPPDDSTDLIVRSHLVDRLRLLGDRALTGAVVMPHVRLSSIGWVVGGAQTIMEALLEAIGPTGTVLVLTGWADRPPYHQEEWSDETRRAYELECPAFDPVLSRAESAMGRFAETVRTWPSAQRSRHPVGSFAAVGPQAEWLIADQRLDEGYGPDSPLERLVEVDGLVLLLGAPLDTVTVLHYAEYLADLPDKRWTEYHMPVVVDGERRWRLIRELDSSRGAFDYARLGLGVDAFEAIVGTALKSGIGVSSTIGAATTHLIPARSLVEFAVTWMEEHFAI